MHYSEDPMAWRVPKWAKGASEVMIGSTAFSIIGASEMADVSILPGALASSMVDKRDFGMAGASVGLLPVEGLSAVDSSLLT